MEQIEALLKRINAENKKTKEVLDNIQKGELNGNVKRKNSGINTLILLFRIKVVSGVMCQKDLLESCQTLD